MNIRDCYGLSIAELLDKAGKNSPDKEAVVDGKRRLTYRELEQEASELACGLKQLGIEPGDRVAVCLPTWYEFIAAVFAIAKAGAVLVPLNTRYRQDEAEHILRDSGTKAVFMTDTFDKVNHVQQFQALTERLPSLQHVITVRFQAKEWVSYDDVKRQHNGERVETKIDIKEDVFAIIYTSGTTGKAKGVMLTHENLVHSMVASCEAIKCQEDDVFLHASPYFHIMGIAGILRLIGSETKAVLMEAYKAEKTLRLIEQERITIHSGVPSIFVLELNHPSFHSYDLSSLRVSIMAGAPCPVETIRKVKQEMGCDVLISYGMTETSPILTMTRFDDDDITLSETVGKAIQGVRLKIVNDTREEMPPGEVGELACQSVGLMKGYYGLPEKTQESIDADRWFYTGDLATMDADGYVRIVGRKKDMIIRGGYNIYPSEIEDVFYSHSDVLEAAVVGVRDTVLGEVSCAAVKVKQHAVITAEDLKAYMKEQVADYKVPDHVVLMEEELPKTPSGKVKKFALRDFILDEKLVSLR